MKPIYVFRYSQIRCFTRHQFMGFGQTLGAIPVKSGDLIMFKKRVMLCVCLAMIFAVQVFPQTIITVAGGGPNNMPAPSAGISPQAIAFDAAGNLYIAHFRAKVFRVDTNGQLTLHAGNGFAGFSGDGGPATSAQICGVTGVTVDNAGNLFIVDECNERVRRVDAATQAITTAAGNGTRGYSGDGGPATSAELGAYISKAAVDGAGNLFIADGDNGRIRRIDAATQVIATVTGSGITGFSGDGGPATSAALAGPYGVAVDSAGNLFIADEGNERIRRVDAATGIITTVAGNGYHNPDTGAGGCLGDGGPATSAELNTPADVAVDSAGNLFIWDFGCDSIRRVDAATQVITSLVPTGTHLNGMALDSAGNLFIVADFPGRQVFRVDTATQARTLVAGNGTPDVSWANGPATDAELAVQDVAVDSTGNVFVADSNMIRRVDAATHTITTVAGTGREFLPSGTFSGDGGPATSADINNPQGVTVDAAGNLFIADTFNERVRRVDAATGVIATVAGNGTAGFTGDGGPATSTELNDPTGIAVDKAGNLFIADTGNRRIRRVDAATQVITTVAGDGTCCFGGEGTPAIFAVLNNPNGVAVDGAGNLFIADTANNKIRRVDASTGIITTVAGNPNCNPCAGFSGDGGPATSAQLNSPQRVAVDSAGDLFVADTGNERIRRVDAGTGVITTFAGNGFNTPNCVPCGGFSGDGGPATSAELNNVVGVAVDGAGNVFISDQGNYRIRQVIAAKQEQTISFAPIPNRTFIPRDSFTISASASSGLPVTFTVGAGQSCSISRSTVQINAVGSCTLTADQGGNSSYNPAPEVTQSFRILYAPAGQPCDGAPGHTILPPINSDNTSIFKQGQTIPAKFRVCDGNGKSVGTPGVVTSFNLIDTFSGTHSTVVSPPTGSLLRFLPSRLTLLAQTNRSRWSLTWAVLCLVTMVMIFIGRREKHRTTPLSRRSAVTALTLVLAAGLVSCGGGTSAPSATNAADPVSSVSPAAPDTQFRWDASDQQWIFNVGTKGLAAGSTYVYRIALNDGTTIVFQFGLN
jgi:sugar lactone lactonase YvrE